MITVTASDTWGAQVTTNLMVTQSSVTVTMTPLDASQLNQQLVNVTGTVSDTNSEVFVNGIEATNNDGIWAATNVPVSPTGTATFDIEGYAGDPVWEVSQNDTQPQPPLVVLNSFSVFAYLATTNVFYGGAGYVQESDNWSWNGAPLQTFYETVDSEYGSSGGSGGFSPDGAGFAAPWVDQDYGYLAPVWEQSAITYNDGYNFEQRTNHTSVMLVSSGGQAAGTVGTYLILAHASEFSVPPFLPGPDFS